MDILVNVANQKLKIATNLKSLVAGTQNFVKFIFNLTGDWDNLTTFAQFSQNGISYNQYLDENNSVYLPTEVCAGTCTLMLYGSNEDIIATTNYLTLFIDENILISDAQSTEISESLYTQLVTKVNVLTTNLESNEFVAQLIGESVQNEMREMLNSGTLTNLTIPDGSIPRSKVDADFNSLLTDVTVSDSNYPFELSDSNGNTIMRIDENGNIITKGFNSNNNTIIDSNYPFELSDSNGNTIMRIDENGNIITKGFNSKNIPNIPGTILTGKVLTSTGTKGVYQWKSPDEKVLHVPWLVDYHRGYAPNNVSENTMPAFICAWKAGADMVEVDARLSSDDVYICSHDDTVTVGNTTYDIAETSSDVLTNLVLSIDDEYGECKIPTTEEVLKFCAHSGMLCSLDIKNVNPDVETIGKLVNKCGMSGKVIYGNITRTNDYSKTVVEIAKDLLNYDRHAMFLFPAKHLDSWVTGFSDRPEVIERSWCWDYYYNAIEHPERIINAHTAGVKYCITTIHESNKQYLYEFQPDCFEFGSECDFRPICEDYLESLGY